MIKSAYYNIYILSRPFLVAQMVKNQPEMQETWVCSLGWEDALEKGRATHSSILTWKIPWTEEPGNYSPWGCKESDMTKWLSTVIMLKRNPGTFLVVQWLRICLAIQETQVQSLVRKQIPHATEQLACTLQLLSSSAITRESVHRSEGSWTMQQDPTSCN